MNYSTSDNRKVKVLVTVKSPPYPSKSYKELVCTAGITSDGEWIRLVPIPYRYLGQDKKFKKFDWIELPVRKHLKDPRLESYAPLDFDNIAIVGSLDKSQRRAFLEPLVNSNLCKKIRLFKQKSQENQQYEAESLFLIKPYQITGFVIEDEDPKWKPEWQQLFEQEPLFEDMRLKPLTKIPFSFSYRFLCSPKCNGHKLKIEDWEIYELARKYKDNSDLLKQKVRDKYENKIPNSSDIYFFIGSTFQFHRRKSKNPYIIIGVFYPLKKVSLPLFDKRIDKQCPSTRRSRK